MELPRDKNEFRDGPIQGKSRVLEHSWLMAGGGAVRSEVSLRVLASLLLSEFPCTFSVLTSQDTAPPGSLEHRHLHPC